MKVLSLSLILCFLSFNLFSQGLTGTKTIKYNGGDYSSIASAINALNSNGVGNGGVTFNIDANFNEVAVNLVITATGTASNPIVFQKSGTGSNPTITAGTGTGTVDAIIKLSGTDYITFNGINLKDTSANTTSNAQVEWGFALMKRPSDSSGCHHVTIKNSTIILNKTNTYTAGINVMNNLSNMTVIIGTPLTINSFDQTNSYNNFSLNNISNVYAGIKITGYSASYPYAIYDQGNEIGTQGGNTITDFGGGSTTTYGIYGIYQNNIKVANNIVSGGAGTSTDFYGISLSTGNNSNAEVSGNKVTLSISGTSSYMYAIHCTIGAAGTTASFRTIKIYNNIVRNCSAITSWTGTFYGIYTSASNSQGTVIVRKNTIDSTSLPGTGTMYGIYQGSSDKIVYIDSNNVNNLSKSGSGTLYGIQQFYTATDGYEYTHNNLVFNLTNTSTGTIYGINSYPISSTNKMVYMNTIHSLSTAGTTIYGLNTQSGDSVYVFKNKIYNLNSSNTNPGIYGLYVNSGAMVNIYNNMISELKAPSGTALISAAGIYVSGGTNVNLHYNSIYLNASSSATSFGTAGVYSSTTPVLEMKNNIIVNNSTPGSSSGRTVAYYRSTTDSTSYSSSSDNNLFYAGTPGPRRLIYYNSSNGDTSLLKYKSRFSPRDANSVTENPPFLNVSTSPYNLHLNTSIATQCENGGIPITNPLTISDDFDGQTRNTSTPDIGADEGNFILLDLTPPVITYTPLGATPYTTARVLNTSITDASGVPTSGNGLPRLFWKKNKNGSWTAVTSSYSGSNTYSFTFGTGVSIGDTVYYYIVAQDIASTPNIGSRPIGASGFSASPPAASTAPANPDFYVIVQSISGTYYVGTGQTYTTLTAAAAAFNSRYIAGNVTFILTDTLYSTSETFPVTFNSNAGSGYNSRLTIKPNTNVNARISGISSTSILKINGADFITIDGSNNGTSSRNLTIENNATLGTVAAIWLISPGADNGSTHNIIKNCKIQTGFNTSSSYGIFAGGASIGSSGYNNDALTIQNNKIQKVYYGIYIYSSSSSMNDSLKITENYIGDDVQSRAIGYKGIWLSGTNAAEILKNEINHIYTTGSINVAGIDVDASNPGIRIINNHIHKLRSLNTLGYGTYGINFASSSGNTSAFIFNNLIYDMFVEGDGTSTQWNPFGIRITGGSNFKIYHNTVYLSDSFGDMTYANMSAALVITSSSVSNINLRNNILCNNKKGYTGTSSYAVYTPAATTFDTIDFNDYWVSGPSGILGYCGASVNTLASWKTITGKDYNSKNADPKFVSSTDLHFGSGYVNNTATPLYVNIDITGITRSSSTPDMGAYEMGLAPSATTKSASSIASYSATLNAIINPNNESSTITFQYGASTSYGNTVAASQSPVGGFLDSNVTASISGLTPSTLYHYRVVAQNGTGTTYGADSTFMTLTVPPVVTTGNTSSVGSTSATLHGTVNASGAFAWTRFYYGTSTTYTDTITGSPFKVSGSTSTSVMASISNLIPNQTYYFKAFAYGPGGQISGGDSTFKTAAAAPLAVNAPASNIQANSVQLNGLVNARNSSTIVVFDWGTTAAYGNTDTAIQSPVSGYSYTNVSKNISGLNPATTYHFRIRAINLAGNATTLDTVFNTGYLAPYARTNAPITVGSSTANLSGTVNAKNDTASVSFQYGPTISYGSTVAAIPAIVTGTSNINVSASISMLTPNTTYHCRVLATNKGGTTYGNDTTFTTQAIAPVATTVNASAIGSTSATLNGSVTANNSPTTVIFEWGLTTAYGNTDTAIQSPVNGMSATAVSKILSGLTSNTTYHYRVKAINQAGTTTGNDRSFTTSHALPTVITGTKSAVTANSAILFGQANANNSDAAVIFEYGTSSTYGSSVKAIPDTVKGTTLTNVQASLNGLVPNTTYHYRLSATNAGGSAYGADSVFLTPAIVPEVSTGNPTNILATSAILNGTVIANNATTYVSFEWGTSTMYGNTVTADQSPVSGMTASPVSFNLLGLTPGATYHYRIVAVNVAGTVYGADSSFTTELKSAPLALTLAATNISLSSAKLNAMVEPSNDITTVTFDWGLTTAYGNSVNATPNTVSGTGFKPVEHTLNGLDPGTTYHYRVVAINAQGTSYGKDTVFTTLPGMPVLTTADVTSITFISAVSGGNITSDGGAAITSRGVVWSTNPSPDISLTTKTSDGSGIGSFSSNLTGLAVKTTYYVRAYATNAAGTAYGDEKIFTTKDMGIDETDCNFKIYSTGKIIQLEYKSGLAEVMVFDISGKQIISTTVNKRGMIDMSPFSSGFYIVRSLLGDRIFCQKVIIE